MLDGKFEAMPVRFRPKAPHLDDILMHIQPNAWQPFGFGVRGCIVSTILLTDLTSGYGTDHLQSQGPSICLARDPDCAGDDRSKAGLVLARPRIPA